MLMSRARFASGGPRRRLWRLGQRQRVTWRRDSPTDGDSPQKADARAAAAIFGGRRLVGNAGSDKPATGGITFVENPERVDGVKVLRITGEKP
jgi:hypothetical protein